VATAADYCLKRLYINLYSTSKMSTVHEKQRKKTKTVIIGKTYTGYGSMNEMEIYSFDGYTSLTDVRQTVQTCPLNVIF
jgi:hypothetical protein